MTSLYIHLRLVFDKTPEIVSSSIGLERLAGEYQEKEKSKAEQRRPFF